MQYLQLFRHPGLAGFLIISFVNLPVTAQTLPPGYLVREIPLNASPLGVAFDPEGVLYALEQPLGNTATIRTIHPDGSFGNDFLVVGNEENFFVGSMTYDPVGEAVLVTDNATVGRLYSVSETAGQQLLASNIPAIAGVAVRNSGEIFVSTALGDNTGEVLQIDRETGNALPVVSGIDFGAGLAFNADGDLLIQDADASTFQGRLQLLPIEETDAGLDFGQLEPLLSNMQSASGIVLDSESGIFTTGGGGLYTVGGEPLEETLFYSDGDLSQFATAIDFHPGSAPFEPFAGPEGGRLALMANFGFETQDTFVTIIEPQAAADFDADGSVDAADLATWEENYGLQSAGQADGDANGNQAVDGADFLVWQRQQLSSTTGQMLQVPEPASGILCLAVLMVYNRRRCIHSYSAVHCH